MLGTAMGYFLSRPRPYAIRSAGSGPDVLPLPEGGAGVRGKEWPHDSSVEHLVFPEQPKPRVTPPCLTRLSDLLVWHSP